ncbi:MAG: SpoIIE family protein phosphatase, partial [Caldilineaceae bacterium]|nr:SpoIIE family protein phosphatase [Caldilineaceae bacterium]
MAPILFPLRRAQFDAIADGWRMLGATDVSLWSPDGLLGQWSSQAPLQAYDLAAPIRVGGRTIGEVRIAGIQDTNTQTQLAQQAELIAQLTFLETDLEQARKVQAGFFPTQMPAVEGLEIFAELRTAAHVGGDYYDFLSHSPQELTFAVGDVCNKGVSAALIMAVLRKVLRTGMKLLDRPSPKDILAYANSDMYEELSSAAMFATSFVGQYDVAN